MAKTRGQLDAQLDELAAWVPMMLENIDEVSPMDAYASRAEMIEAQASPDDAGHVHDRLQRIW